MLGIRQSGSRGGLREANAALSGDTMTPFLFDRSAERCGGAQIAADRANPAAARQRRRLRIAA
jgi:hypothetical protein